MLFMNKVNVYHMLSFKGQSVLLRKFYPFLISALGFRERNNLYDKKRKKQISHFILSGGVSYVINKCYLAEQK